jgi:glycosyltransferase involved in cell wall biosynthesis
MSEKQIIHICNAQQSKYGPQLASEIHKNHQECDIVSWDIDLYLQLAKIHYPELLDLMNSFEFNIQKAFVGRLAVLHRYGGLLISNTMRPIKNIHKLINMAQNPVDAYVKANKPQTVLFEHLPLDFEENQKLSMSVILSEKFSDFLQFCIDSLIQYPTPWIESEELFDLSLQNVDKQSIFIDKQCGNNFLYNSLKKYIAASEKFEVSVLPYYFINPCVSSNMYDKSQVIVFNGPVKDDQKKLAEKNWGTIGEDMISKEKFSNSFMQDTEPQKTTGDMIKTKVAMIAWQFPNRANTFVMNEVMEMHRRGVDLTIYSMSFPTAECKIIYKDELEKIGHKIVCVPQNKLIDHKKIQEDRIAFFQNDFRLNLNLCKTIDPTSETFNQQEQECVQNSSGFLEKFVEDIKFRGIEKIYAPFANGDAEIAMMISYHTGIPYYFTAHAYDLFSSYNYTRMKSKTVSHVFAISEYNKNYMIKELGLPKEKITVRRINILKPNLEEVRAKNITEDFIFSAGRLDEMKGFKYSIEAFSYFHEHFPKVHYIIAGTGELEPEIRELITSLNLEKFVHLLGHVKNYEVLEFAKSAQFSILSSIEMPNKDKEGLPTCFVESMSLGTPCIGTDYSGTPELIDHGINGMLTKEKDVNDIADKMCKLYNMIKCDSTGAISESCKSKVSSIFNNEENINLLLEHLK